jgi:hypothetical protein
MWYYGSQPLPAAIAQAARRYHQRFARWPTVLSVRPDVQLPAGLESSLRVITDNTILTGHLLLGEEN